MHPTLIMTVGLPQSGKSTWAKKQCLPIVNPDAIRLALYGSAYESDGERMVWTIAHYMVKALFLAGHKRVVLDATNTTRARREEWKAPHEMWNREYKLFRASRSVCISRAIKADKHELFGDGGVIDRMATYMTWPTLDESP
jgi:predicted kinase